jgi:CHAD domain-containing protein
VDVLQHLSVALAGQWRRYRKRLKRCQRKFSASAVHDSRIEMRRLLATLELVAVFIPERKLKKLRRALKDQLDEFDQLRDAQVQLAGVKPLRRAFPAAKKFHRWLRQREVRYIREALQAVKAVKTRRVGKRIAALEGELRRQQKSTTPDRAFGLAQDAIDNAFAGVTRFSRQVNAAAPPTIHRTRIAFKRFRYMVDALSPLLPAVTDKHRRAMHDYQSMMGDIQDSEVLLAALDEFIESEDNKPTMQPLRAALVQRRKQLIHVYLDAAPKLASFWPPKALPPRPTRGKRKQP